MQWWTGQWFDFTIKKHCFTFSHIPVCVQMCEEANPHILIQYVDLESFPENLPGQF